MADPPRAAAAPGLWSMSGEVRARFVQPLVQTPWWALPMNGQAARTEMVRQLIRQCAIERIVETGTFIGTTTEFFAEFGVPVTTVESNPKWAQLARQRLHMLTNVDPREAMSVDALRSLTAEPIDRNVPILFYLDAHWHDHLPLREEAEIAFGHFSKAVLLVDDFAVPDDAGYSFDDYGPDKRLNLDYLRQAKLPPYAAYFPATPSHAETGSRRGCVVLAVDPGLIDVLDGLALLRRWTTRASG